MSPNAYRARRAQRSAEWHAAREDERQRAQLAAHLQRTIDTLRSTAVVVVDEDVVEIDTGWRTETL